jgi:hypothetical protein
VESDEGKATLAAQTKSADLCAPSPSGETGVQAAPNAARGEDAVVVVGESGSDAVEGNGTATTAAAATAAAATSVEAAPQRAKPHPRYGKRVGDFSAATHEFVAESVNAETVSVTSATQTNTAQ